MVKANHVTVQLVNADIEKVKGALAGFEIEAFSAYGIFGLEQDFNTTAVEVTSEKTKIKASEVIIKGEVEEDKGLEFADEEVPEEELPFEKNVEEEKVEEKPKASKSNYNNMTMAELRDEIERRGLDAKSVKKQPLVDALIEDDKGATSEEIDEVDETKENSGSKYEGRKAMDLYKEAIDRGLNVKPRQKASFYVEILEENDAEELAKQKDKVEEVDEEWEDVLEEEDEWDI